MAVGVKSGESFEAGKPTPLFHVEWARSDLGQYEMAADGQRFIVNTGGGYQTPITVAVNWGRGLKALSRYSRRRIRRSNLASSNRG
jgi:hypothetical protein